MPSAVPASTTTTTTKSSKLPKQSSITNSNSGGEISGVPSSTATATTTTLVGNLVPEKSDAAPVIAAIENKIRNLEKRKVKLLRIEEDLKKGKEVTKEQMEAASHLGEVEQQLEAMKELLKAACDGLKQQLKQKKQERKAEQKERVQSEIGRLRDLLQIQETLSTLGHDEVRKEFLNGVNGAMKLSALEVEKLDELFRKICPSHEDLNDDQQWGTYVQESSFIVYSLLTNSMNAVPFYEGKTYRDLRTQMEDIISCAYFVNKFGRAQTPEQAKSEAASTISNVDENVRGNEKSHEHQQISGGYNNGRGNGALPTGSASPPRQPSPAALIGQGGNQNIGMLQDDQSGAYATPTANFEGAINTSMPYVTGDPNAYMATGYNSASAASGVVFQQQQHNQMGGYGMAYDPHDPSNAEHMIAMKQLDPNAPTFVSLTENTPVYASAPLVTSAPMSQEPNVAQYYQQQQHPIEDQAMMQQDPNNENADEHGNSDGFVHQNRGQGNQGYYNNSQRGGGRGRGGGYRGRGDDGHTGGRGGGFRGGYRGRREGDGGQGNWQGQQRGYDDGQGGGYRGRGGGGYRGDRHRGTDEYHGGAYEERSYGRGGGRGGGGGAGGGGGSGSYPAGRGGAPRANRGVGHGGGAQQQE